MADFEDKINNLPDAHIFAILQQNLHQHVTNQLVKDNFEFIVSESTIRADLLYMLNFCEILSNCTHFCFLIEKSIPRNVWVHSINDFQIVHWREVTIARWLTKVWKAGDTRMGHITIDDRLALSSDIEFDVTLLLRNIINSRTHLQILSINLYCFFYINVNVLEEMLTSLANGRQIQNVLTIRYYRSKVEPELHQFLAQYSNHFVKIMNVQP